MADIAFNRGIAQAYLAAINYSTADLRCLLLKSGTPVKTNDFVSDLVPATNEVSVAGYSRQVLTGEAVTQIATGADLKAQKAVFSGLAAGETVTFAVIFVHTGVDTTATLIVAVDITDLATNGGDIEIRWDGTDGLGIYAQVTGP